MNLGLIPSPQFVMMRFDLLDSEQFDLMHPQAIKLYLKLRRFVWRSEEKGRLAEHYIKGNLAVEGYCSQWAEWLKTSRTTAGRMVKELEDAGWIIRVYQSRGREDPNVLYLGFWIEVGEDRVEIYFPDTTSPKETVAVRGDTVAPVGGTRAPMHDTRAPMHGTRAPVHTSNIEGNRELLIDPPDDFSDILSPSTPRPPSAIEQLIAEKKATMTQEQFDQWRALGGPAQLYADHGGAPSVPPDAGGADRMGTSLWSAFKKLAGIGSFSEAKVRQNTRRLREIVAAYPGVTPEMAIEALDVAFLDDFAKRKTTSAFFGYFEGVFNKALSRVAEGTLDDYRRELTSGGHLRSQSGGEEPRGGVTEDQRIRRETVERLARRGRERARENMPSLRDTTDP